MKTTSSGSTAALLVVLVAMLAVEAAVQVRAAEISCPDVINDLSTCLPFLQGNAARPTDQCCVGVRTLYAAANTRPARRATCECLKTAYKQVGAQLPAAQALPGDCGVPIDYEITPDIDCNKIA